MKNIISQYLIAFGVLILALAQIIQYYYRLHDFLYGTIAGISFAMIIFGIVKGVKHKRDTLVN